MSLTDAPERFMAKIQVDDNGCWLWTAAKDRYGYGSFTVGGIQYFGTRRRKPDWSGPRTEPTMSELLKLLGLDEFPPEIEAEYNATIAAIEEAERQAAIHAHKVFIR